MTGPERPALIAAPGMHLAEALARSTARVRAPADLRGRGAAQPLEIHIFGLEDDVHGFQLMPGRYTLLSLQDARIDAVHVSPHEEYLDADQAATLLERCADRLAQARWSRTSSESPARACAVTEATGEALAGTWRAAQWTAELRLRRVHQVDTPIARLLGLARDAHLVTLSIALAR